jgi:23S rRNA (uracil1939-C5)-methyltransferase
MVILGVQSLEEEIIHGILDILRNRFPGITSLYYVINPKKNDSVSDLEHHLYHGMPVIRETLPSVRQGFKETRFEIGPKSFFQTNPVQARKLYQIVMEFAEIRGHEMVWDLYTGTGTIANYIAPHVKQVTGIESVPEAIEDARKNSALNDLTNTMFLAGEAEALLTPEFIARYGRPDIVITDPPRSGMHEKVIRTILAALPEKVIYVSCNPATQARDAGLLSGSYEPVRSQPVDMFPHTHHVENVLLLRRREDLPSETQDIRDHQ